MRYLKSLILLSSLALVGCTNPPNIPVKKTKIKPLVFRSKSLTREGKPIIVAVIDTGIADDYKDSSFLCKFGHKDFTGTGLTDTHGHGTHVSGLIDQYVKNIILDEVSNTIDDITAIPASYCQVVLKFYDPKQEDKHKNMSQEIAALRHAININVDVINFSGGGTDFDEEEKKLIKIALDKGIKIIVAAGNEGADLKMDKYYPAVLDERLVVVGNLDNNGLHHRSSNYGDSVDVWEKGTARTSYGSHKSLVEMTGTSQATAVKTGKMVREMLLKK